jgi:hypothetical protein
MLQKIKCPTHKEPQILGKKDRYKYYGKNKSINIQNLYLVAVALWIALCVYFNLIDTDWIGILILVIPVFIFGISYANANYLNIDLEDEMFTYDYFTLGMLLALPLLVWVSNNLEGDRTRFIRIIVTAISLTLLGLFDVWLRKKWVTFIKHAKSVLQTYAVTLLIYAFYNYYIMQGERIFVAYK